MVGIGLGLGAGLFVGLGLGVISVSVVIGFPILIIPLLYAKYARIIKIGISKRSNIWANPLVITHSNIKKNFKEMPKYN